MRRRVTRGGEKKVAQLDPGPGLPRRRHAPGRRPRYTISGRASDREDRARRVFRATAYTAGYRLNIRGR